MLNKKTVAKEWQVGDGREQALGDYVQANARRGDLDDVIRVIDEFVFTRSWLMNVGDEKGEILDQAIRRSSPRLVLELGTYLGYSALRMARVMPADGRLYSLEFNESNAAIARAIWDHAGVGDRLTVLVGTLGDGGATIERLRAECGLDEASVDFVFVDHDKDHYVSDLELILAQGWLHAGSIVMADNVKFPGAPEYLDYIRAAEAKTWRTVEYDSHVEGQSMIKDLMLESEYLGANA